MLLFSHTKIFYQSAIIFLFFTNKNLFDRQSIDYFTFKEYCVLTMIYVSVNNMQAHIMYNYEFSVD